MARTISGITGTIVSGASDSAGDPASLSAAAIVAGGTTISGSYAYTVTLTSQTNNPVSVTGTVSVADGTALTAPGNGGAYTWAVNNSGTLSGGGTGHLGVQLGSAAGPVSFGTVSNQSGGRITGGERALGIYGPGLVNNLSGGYIAGTGESGVYIAETGTVTNGGAVSGGIDGVYLHSDGTVTNLPGGNIGGLSARAVNINGDATRAATEGQPNVQVYNAGTLSGVGFGVFELRGGSVTNALTGTIIGTSGPGILLRGPSTVINSGAVSSAVSYAVYLYGSGSVTNSADGVLSGGVYIGYFPGVAGTFINAGTVIANGAYTGAVRFGSRGLDLGYRLIAEPGAVFIGAVDGGGGAMELASASGTGTLSGFGTSITNFSTLQFDQGARWELTGDTAGFGAIETITGFAQGDTIDLTDFQATSASFANNTLTLTDVSGGQQALAIDGSFDTNAFRVSPLGTAGSSIVVGRTISGSYNTGIDLSSQTDNPVLVTGTLSVASGNALYGQGGGNRSWTISNAGTITSGDEHGIVLGGGSQRVTTGIVTNEATGLISSTGAGVDIYADFASVTNLSGGRIVSSGSLSPAILVNAQDAVLANQAGATISSNYYAVNVREGVATITNAGTLSAARTGIFLYGEGSVTNLPGGVITGDDYMGIRFWIADGTVTNSGRIDGATKGVGLYGGGSVFNLTGGTITNGVAIVNTAGTVSNAGRIIGNVDFYAPTTSNLLIVDPAASFQGDIHGGNGVLELASGTDPGTLYGLGTSITNFSTLQFDQGARWKISGDAAGFGSVAINGFGSGDEIDLTDFQATSASFANNTLTLTDVGGGQQTLAMVGAFRADAFRVSSLGTTGSSIVVGRTIAGSYNTGIDLSSQSDNPVRVTGTIAIVPSGGRALTGQGGSGNTWTIDNEGAISAGSGGAVVLGPPGSPIAGGVFTNERVASVYSPNYGVYINGPGSITNMAGARIAGKTFSAMYILNGPGTIVNAGTVSAGSVAAFEDHGGSVTNLAGGTLLGSGGVLFKNAPGTLTNAGTIIGNDTNANPLWRSAVTFRYVSTSNRLIVDPGAVFDGNIRGGDGIVELAPGSGTISGFGTSITNFSSLQFDQGANWNVVGQIGSTGLSTIAISGFDNGDTIDVINFVAQSATFASNTLTLTSAGGAQETLQMLGNFAADAFQVSGDGSGGTDVTATCYAAGTQILTPRGEVAVEYLHEGDLVHTISGRSRPILWIGRRRVEFHRHPNRRRILPVRIAAHAFGRDQPKRDLLLSPDHAVFVDGVLIPIRHLVNGGSITQIQRHSITYYHIELFSHDVLIANGLPAESYLEAGARDAFAGTAAVTRLYPDFASPRHDYAVLWELYGYAPLVIAGPELERVRRRLADRDQLAA